MLSFFVQNQNNFLPNKRNVFGILKFNESAEMFLQKNAILTEQWNSQSYAQYRMLVRRQRRLAMCWYIPFDAPADKDDWPVSVHTSRCLWSWWCGIWRTWEDHRPRQRPHAATPRASHRYLDSRENEHHCQAIVNSRKVTTVHFTVHRGRWRGEDRATSNVASVVL